MHINRRNLLTHLALGAAAPALRAKTYAGRERIELPDASDPGQPLTAALSPSADTAHTTLTLSEVARQLRLANGVTGRRRLGGDVVHLRAAPSAGALYADEVYLLASRVDGLEPGAYYYDVVAWDLWRLRRGRKARRDPDPRHGP